jgi:hypothetical protein
MTPPLIQGLLEERRINDFFVARGSPIPPDTPALPLALQIIYLYYPLGRWILHNRLSRHPLTLHTALLATPFIQDVAFNLFEIPEEIRLSYFTFLYSCGRRTVPRTELYHYLMELTDHGQCDASLLLNTEDLFVLMYYKETDIRLPRGEQETLVWEEHITDYVLINVITGKIRHEKTVERCMDDLPDRVMRVLSMTVNTNQTYQHTP